MAISYARIAVYIVSVARSSITLIIVDMFRVVELIARFALITIPSGVSVARILTRTNTLVMR
jgi:hypothetical protein